MGQRRRTEAENIRINKIIEDMYLRIRVARRAVAAGTQTPEAGTQTPEAGTQTPEAGTQTPEEAFASISMIPQEIEDLFKADIPEFARCLLGTMPTIESLQDLKVALDAIPKLSREQKAAHTLPSR